MTEEEDVRFFASFVTSEDDEAARSLRQLVELPASADEIASICRAEKLPARLLDLEGRTVGHVDATGKVTLG